MGGFPRITPSLVHLSQSRDRLCGFPVKPLSGSTVGVGGRQSPTVYNTAFNHVQFWDGRARSLEEQAIGPIHNPVEMAETHEHVVSKLSKIKGYQQQFRAVFGAEVSLQGIAETIAAYERTVLSTNSAFDKYMLGDQKAMDEAAVRGLALFKAKPAACFATAGANLTDNQFHNLGVPQVGPMKGTSVGITSPGRKKDKRAFKTPTLRSITKRRHTCMTVRLRRWRKWLSLWIKGGSNPKSESAGETFELDRGRKDRPRGVFGVDG